MSNRHPTSRTRWSARVKWGHVWQRFHRLYCGTFGRDLETSQRHDGHGHLMMPVPRDEDLLPRLGLDLPAVGVDSRQSAMAERCNPKASKYETKLRSGWLCSSKTGAVHEAFKVEFGMLSSQLATRRGMPLKKGLIFCFASASRQGAGIGHRDMEISRTKRIMLHS